ncbi:MAG: CDP-alcohol phosphatidyltransferase family protein, partial [Pseudomonadota bacterium]
ISDENRKRATRSFMKTNWCEHDGIVARYLNKHISVRISALLANTSITPNQMTSFAFLVALVGIALIARGGYWAFLCGAFLLQIQSILDGCDGELARLHHQGSRFGAWYDTVVDDVLGILMIAALGIGTYRTTGHWFWIALNVGAAVSYAGALGTIYFALFRAGGEGHQDFTWWFEEDNTAKEAASPSLSSWAKYCLRRDFYVLFFFVLAICNLMLVAALFAATGAICWTAVTVIQVRKRGLAVHTLCAKNQSRATFGTMPK